MTVHPDSYYHFMAHAVGNDNLFLSEDNYLYYLKNYEERIHPFVSTLSYCLMPNHFHILFKSKAESEIHSELMNKKIVKEGQRFIIGKKLGNQIGHLLNGYAQAFNRKYDRRGSLFMHPSKLQRLDSNQYLKNCIAYIHQNPVHHGFAKNPEDWKWSSIHSFGTTRKTRVNWEKALELFNGFDDYKTMLHSSLDPKLILDMEF